MDVLATALTVPERDAAGPGRSRPPGVTVGLVGSGIAPSLSPALHEREGAELGLHYRYRRLDLDVMALPATAIGQILRRAREAGYRGLNVTHPCKQQVIEHLDALSPDAVAIGAVNTVVFDGDRATGHNTDWSGFRDGLLDGLPGAPRDRVVLLGAGGAGAAAAYALLSSGTQRLDVVDLDPDRATRLAASLNDRFGADGARGHVVSAVAERLAVADGLVHATPIGMAAHPGLPVPRDVLRPDLWVADIVYRPLDTALLRAAREIGCRTLDGGRMAVHQAATALRLFTGLEPDTARMRRHFGELVRAEAGRDTAAGQTTAAGQHAGAGQNAGAGRDGEAGRVA